MMKCETCKYWYDKDNRHHIIPNVHLCKKPVQYWDATEWGDVDRQLKEEHKDLKMFVQDGSDYYASLLTRNDFFCAHWESKE